jgi:hypothetical protein
MARRIPLLVLLALWLAPLRGFAESIPITFAATRVPERFSSSRQAVAPLADGGLATVWTTGMSSPYAVRMQWVRADGSFAFPRRGLLVAAGFVGAVSIAANPHGGVFVAFFRIEGTETGLFVQSFDNAGLARWAAGGAQVAKPERREIPANAFLVPHPDGGVFVCFERYNSRVHLSDVVCQRLSAEGQPLWSKRGAEVGGAFGDKRLPQALSDGAGGLIVAWRNGGDPFGDRKPQSVLIEGQRFSGAGARSWGKQGKILQATGLKESDSYSSPALVLLPDGAGGVLLVCDVFLSLPAVPTVSPNMAIVAQRISPAGQRLWGNGVTVAALPEGQNLDDAVAGPGGGAFLAAHTGWRLRLYRIGPAGELLWPGGVPLADPAAIDPSDYESGARVAFDGEHLRAVWSHNPKGEIASEVRTAAFDLSGTRLGAPGGEILTPAAAGAWDSVNGFAWNDASDRGLTVWTKLLISSSDSQALGALCDEDCGTTP